MELNEVIKNRCSIRKFSNNLVRDEDINSILDAGRLAPTAKNEQNIKIYVVKSEEGIKAIDEASPCRYNAQVVLLVASSKSSSFKKEGHNTYDIDASIVTTHMMLEATNLKIDSIWIEMFDEKILHEKLNIPDDYSIVSMLDLGYRDEGVLPSPFHDKRKSVDELVEYR